MPWYERSDGKETATPSTISTLASCVRGIPKTSQPAYVERSANASLALSLFDGNLPPRTDSPFPSHRHRLSRSRKLVPRQA